MVPLAFCLTWPVGLSRAQEGASEQDVRAAMVFNFLKFTEWPARGSGIPLCVASGDRKQFEALRNLSGKTVGGEAIDVIRCPARAPSCRVLYVDARQRWEEAAGDRSHPLKTLTIGAYPGFALDGGMIEIVQQQGHVRFDVNLGEVRRAGLRLDPQLLRLARQVLE